MAIPQSCHFNQGLFPSKRSDATVIKLKDSLPPARSQMRGESYVTHSGISSFPCRVLAQSSNVPFEQF